MLKEGWGARELWWDVFEAGWGTLESGGVVRRHWCGVGRVAYV